MTKAKEKQVVIDSMDVTLVKVTVKREGKRDELKEAMAYLTFDTVLTDKMLTAFGLSDIARDPRFKMGEEIILSQAKQGLHGTIDLLVSFIGPLTGQVKPLIESGGMLTEMSLMGEVFSVEVSYLLLEDEDWTVFGNIFTNLINADMKITAKPDNRGKQEPLIVKLADDARKTIGENLNEDESITFQSGDNTPVTVKGKKKKKGEKKA